MLYVWCSLGGHLQASDMAKKTDGGNMYKEKSKGPKTESCGTPQEMLHFFKECFHSKTMNFLLTKYDFNHYKTVPEKCTCIQDQNRRIFVFKKWGLTNKRLNNVEKYVITD